MQNQVFVFVSITQQEILVKVVLEDIMEMLWLERLMIANSLEKSRYIFFKLIFLKRCDCPEGGPCTIVSDGTYCTDCPEGGGN